MKHPNDFKHLFPKKKFGQNFLVSMPAIDTIIDHAMIERTDTVVEIGPGIGALSEFIIGKAGHTILIEKDRTLVDHLQKEYADEIEAGIVEVIEKDACFVDYNELVAGQKFKVVSNLPYNACTPILFNLYEYKDQITQMTLMFQREVAQRIIAVPATRKFGVLSVNVQIPAEIYEVIELEPKAFFPSPKVHSTVLNFKFLEKPRIDIADHDFFHVMLKAAFFRKRRTVQNSLDNSNAFPGLNIKEMFENINIDPKKRAEAMTLEEWKILFDYLYPLYQAGTI